MPKKFKAGNLSNIRTDGAVYQHIGDISGVIENVFPSPRALGETEED
jgi:hypothetical protein